MTKILMISTDAKILEKDSLVRARMAEYGALFGELHIIVFSKKGEAASSEKVEIARNTFAYPTDSISKLLYVADAGKIGSSIIAARGMNAADSVITTQDPFETGIVGKKLSEKTKIPLHVQIHTDFHSPYFKGSILNRVRIALAKKTLARAAAVRAVSERIKDSLEPHIRAKASVLPIFADMTAIKSAPVAPAGDLHKKYPRFGKIVLMASRLTKEKDFKSALTAFARAAESQKDAGLVIVGAGPEEKNIRAEIVSLSLGDRAVIEPWADRATIISYMKMCDAFLSASLYEGYGLSMLEAYAAGATLVATDAGIAPLLAGEDALALPGDPEALASALAKALSGQVRNKAYSYPYPSKDAYLEAFKRDIERALL